MNENIYANKTISVIIPIYKVEKYLKKCIDSILAQTYKPIEIILVDDGSPDSCPSICDEYALKHDNIKVVHKANGGLSSARNAGIDIATGEYYSFVDSDDYIAPDMIEKLYDALKKSSADLSVCNPLYIDENGKQCRKSDVIKTEILNREQMFEKLNFPQYYFYVSAWSKLYSRHLFDEIRYPVGLLHEDEAIIHHIFKKAERMACIDDTLYFYLQRDGSIMNSPYTVKRLDVFSILIDRMLLMKSSGYQKYLATTARNAYETLLTAYESADLSNIDAAAAVKRCKKLFNNNLSLFLNSGAFKVREKINVWAFYFGYKPYRFLVNLRK